MSKPGKLLTTSETLSGVSIRSWNGNEDEAVENAIPNRNRSRKGFQKAFRHNFPTINDPLNIPQQLILTKRANEASSGDLDIRNCFCSSADLLAWAIILGCDPWFWWRWVKNNDRFGTSNLDLPGKLFSFALYDILTWVLILGCEPRFPCAFVMLVGQNQ